MSAPMSAAARWSIPGRRSAPARRSARTAICRAGSGSAACSNRCRPSRSSSRTIASSARAARSSRASSSRRARCWRWARSSARRQRSSTAPPAKSIWAGAGLFGRRAGIAARQAPARRQPRPEPLLRGHRQAGRRPDPRPHLDQRIAAGLSGLMPSLVDEREHGVSFLGLLEPAAGGRRRRRCIGQFMAESIEQYFLSRGPDRASSPRPSCRSRPHHTRWTPSPEAHRRAFSSSESSLLHPSRRLHDRLMFCARPRVDASRKSSPGPDLGHRGKNTDHRLS